MPVITRDNRVGGVRAAVLGVLAATLLGGCGWTARDDYYKNQKVSFRAAMGDSSVVIFSPEPAWPRERRGTSVAAVDDR
jgi:hypothetical protein